MKVIKSNACLVVAFFIFFSFGFFLPLEKDKFDIEKKFTVVQLKQDFKCFRDTLEKYHPRLYEFTEKKRMDNLFDSLYNGINKEMNEIQFRYYLLPIIQHIHCSHTGVGSSVKLNDVYKGIYKFPPFKLYYEGDKAFILHNFSKNKSLEEGTEVIVLNNIPAKKIIERFLNTTTLEGTHSEGQYYRMNEMQTSLFNGMPDYYKQNKFVVQTKDKNDKITQTTVSSVTWKEYQNFLSQRYNPKIHSLNFIDSLNAALLTFPFFQFSIDTMYESYIPGVFRTLKEKNVKNLIIDLRGNGGGPGFVAGNLLRHLLKERFVYYDTLTTTGPGFEEFKQHIDLSPDAFKGNLICLMDEGCLSSSGHFLSMIKYHKRGTLIGGLCTAGYSCNGNGIPHELPNTKIFLYCPFAIYDTKTAGFKRSEGIKPDIEIRPTFSDILYKRDPVLNYALASLRKN